LGKLEVPEGSFYAAPFDFNISMDNQAKKLKLIVGDTSPEQKGINSITVL
jgi:hypothetical protein